MAEGKTEWPQSLKDFANRAFSESNDSNRKAVSEELRSVIADAWTAGTVHSTDWSSVRLKSLGGSSSGAGASASSSTKMGKKRMLASGSSSPSPSLYDDQDKREKRARRFEKEQQEFIQDQQSGWSQAAAPTSMSLAGRLGGPQQPAATTTTGKKKGKKGIAVDNVWTYDPSPTPVKSRNKWASDPVSASTSAYGAGLAGRGFVDESLADPNVIDWDRDTVVGLSTKLEKPYLRLTSAPDPKTVRPLPILQQTLELLKKKWRDEGNYAYICDQFKSLRQDLTVQRIKNEFTVNVYEIHARIALEKGDLGEYNQCQSQLRTLYAYGLPGRQMEFLAYRILYLLHTQNRREVNALMSELTPASKAVKEVAHALNVRLALAIGNYSKFFQLYLEAPCMNGYIIDHFAERERVAALTIMAKSYRPSLPLQYISDQLGFFSLAEAHDFLTKHSIALYVEPTPAELAAAEAAAASSSNGVGSTSTSRRKKGNAPPARLPLESRKWDCKAALPGVIAAGDKYRKIDIKGQI